MGIMLKRGTDESVIGERIVAMSERTGSRNNVPRFTAIGTSVK